MNLRDIFKAKNSISVKTKIQKMDKKQLEKVIGGADTSGTSTNVTTPKQTQGSTFGE